MKLKFNKIFLFLSFFSLLITKTFAEPLEKFKGRELIEISADSFYKDRKELLSRKKTIYKINDVFISYRGYKSISFYAYHNSYYGGNLELKMTSGLLSDLDYEQISKIYDNPECNGNYILYVQTEPALVYSDPEKATIIKIEIPSYTDEQMTEIKIAKQKENAILEAKKEFEKLKYNKFTPWHRQPGSFIWTPPSLHFYNINNTEYVKFGIFFMPSEVTNLFLINVHTKNNKQFAQNIYEPISINDNTITTGSECLIPLSVIEESINTDKKLIFEIPELDLQEEINLKDCVNYKMTDQIIRNLNSSYYNPTYGYAKYFYIDEIKADIIYALILENIDLVNELKQKLIKTEDVKCQWEILWNSFSSHNGAPDYNTLKNPELLDPNSLYYIQKVRIDNNVTNDSEEFYAHIIQVIEEEDLTDGIPFTYMTYEKESPGFYINTASFSKHFVKYSIPYSMNCYLHLIGNKYGVPVFELLWIDAE